MPIYDITSPKTGRIYRVSNDQEPTEESINKTVSYYDALAEEDLINPQRATQQPEDTGQGRLSSAASNVGRGALSVIPGTIGGVGYLTGSDTLVGAAKDVEQGIEKMLPVNPAYQEEISQKAANVLGQAGGMLLTGGAAGALGKGRALAKGLEAAAAAAKGTKVAQAASLGTGMLQGAYGGGQEAEKYGLTGGSAYARALLGGALEGATEKYLFGMGTELAPVRKFLGDTVERGVGNVLKSAGTEAGEEVVSQIGGNIATKALAPTGVTTPDVMSGVGEAALLGGIAGGALGGVNNLMSGSEAPTVEGATVEEAPEPIDPLVAQTRAAMAEEVTVDDLVQSAQERFGVLQAKAADQTTPLTQEEADEMDELTAAFADPANIDPAALADLYDVRIAQPVAPVDRATEIQTRLAEIETERGPREETTFTPEGTPVTQPYRVNTTEEDALLKELEALNQAPAPVAPAPAPAPNPIAQNAINAANKPDASLPLTAALLNSTPEALNPPPTPQQNATTQEYEIESPSGTPPVQGQPADQGANRQAPQGTPQREGEGQEVAPTEVVEPEQIIPEKGDEVFVKGGDARITRRIDNIFTTEGKQMVLLQGLRDPIPLENTTVDPKSDYRRRKQKKTDALAKQVNDAIAAGVSIPKQTVDGSGLKMPNGWTEGGGFYNPPTEGAEVAPAGQGPQFSQGGGTAQDAEYLELAKDPEKNRTLLQKMVDVAAKAAGYITPKVFHGSPSKAGFTVFDPTKGKSFGGVNNVGSWWTTNPKQAKAFAEYYDVDSDGRILGAKEGDVYQAYLNMGRVWEAGSLDNFFRVVLGRSGKTELADIGPAEIAKIREYFKNSNIDSVRIADTTGDDMTGQGSGEYYLTLKPEQIKSADPVTYDNAGNVIPLSQRFNEAVSDIRFSQNDQAKTAQDAEYNRIMARYEGTPRIAFIKKRRYSPIVRDLLNRRKDGENIPADILDRAIREYFPSATVAVPKTLQDIPSQELVERSITSNKLVSHKEAMEKGAPPAGSKITVRQDVPAMDQHGVGVVTTRTENGTFYLPATRFYDPVFKPNERGALNIGLGENKDSVIAILGKWSQDQSMPEDLENWTQVGFNPDRHSYYYERGTDRQVTGGTEAFQIGNTVFVKDAVFSNTTSPIRYSQGGQANTSLPVEKVTTVVDQVMAKNKSPLQVRVITRDELENSDEFQDIRDALDSQGADMLFTEAWVDRKTQTVVVVADSFSNAARIREVLVHEIIGHAGVDAFASEADISRVLKILDRRVPDLVNQVRARYPNLNEAGIAREVIAKFSEQYQSADFASLPSGMKALWRELKAWLGGIIQRLNVNIAAFDDLTLNWFYTNAVNAAAGITPLPAPTAATAVPVAAAPAPAAEVAPEVATEVAPAPAAEVAPAVEAEAEAEAAPEVASSPAPAVEAEVAPEAAPAAEVAPAPAPAAKKKLVLPPARIRQKAAPAPVPAEAENPIGVANAIVDAARAKLGLPPVFAPIRQSFGALWDQALRAIAMNTERGTELVDELNNKSREISALETAILTHELVNRTLAFDRATEALNSATESEKEEARKRYDRTMAKLQEAWNASDVSGTEQGRSLNARKMLVALDYTLAKMVSMRTAAAERPLSDEQRAQTEELFAKIEALQKKLAEFEKSGKTSGEEARLEDLLASVREEGKLEAQKEAKLLEEAAAILKAEEAARASAVKKGADPAKVLEDSVDAARARLRARKGLFGAKTPEAIQEELNDIQFSIADAGIVGLSSQDIADLTIVGKSYIAEGATTLESWSEKMVEEFGEDITDYLEPLYENSKAPVAAAPAAKTPKAPKAAPAEKAPKEKKLKASPMARIKADAKEGKELSPKLVYELVKQKLQEGISGVENVFKAVTQDLQEEFPLMTEREIRDIFSGYGKPIFPSGEDLAKALRELRRLSQLTSALEDAKAFIIPLKSGQQRAAVTEAIRNLQKEIARVMQENNLVRSTTSKQLKSTLDSIKTRLRNQIVDLNAQIKKKEKAPKKAGVVYDQEANDLRAERDRLQEVLNNLVGPSQPSPSQRIRQRVNQLQKEITDLEKKVATRDITKPATQPVPETARIQVLKDQKAALLEQLHVIRVEIEGEPSLTQEQINERAEKAIRRNIEDLEQRIKEKDVSRKEGKQADGPVIAQLRAQRDALREQYNALREAIQGKPQKTDQQRIKMANDALDSSIKDLEDQIATGNIGVKPKGAPIETPELKAKRAQRDALKKVRDGMRTAVKKALADPVAKQLARDKKNITRQIEKLRKRIADRDFSKPTKIVRTTDQEKQKLEVELNMLKSDWSRILFEEKLANRTTTQKLLGGASQTLNTARAILTSFDFSGVLRQGGFIVLGNPLRAIKNLRPMFAAFASKEAETKAKLDLRNRENFALYQRDKLFLADMDTTPSMAKQEENYASLWVDKIPKLLGGGLIRGSQRGYVTFLNNLRADSYDAMLLAFRKGPVATPEESKAIADYINIATGRGDLGKFSQAAEGLNTVFFAPRLVASRFQLLLGMPYFSATGRTKNLVLQEYAKFLTGVAVVYLLGMLAQEDEDKPIETDPRSTNFGKIRFGDSRIDPLSGLQQATVLLARLVSGQTKTSTGKIVDIRGENVPYGGATPVNILAKFARSKLSPVVGSITNMVQGENVIGEKVTPFGELERMVVPMSFEEVGKVMEEQGVPKGMVISTLALFGMGVQTYDETKKR